MAIILLRRLESGSTTIILSQRDSMCRDEVMLEAEDMSGAPPGSQAFLGSLQDATTKLWKRLSEADQQIYIRKTLKC
jgi:hypothetical protein